MELLLEMLPYVGGGLVLVLLARGLYAGLIARYVIHETQCGLIYKNGRFVRQVGPGVIRLFRRSGSLTCVDLRRRIVAVPGQEVLTADQACIKVSLVITFEIVDPAKALHQVDDYVGALYKAAQLALRKAVSGLSLEELLEQRVEIGPQITTEVQLAEQWGLRVHSVHVRDVMLPAEVRRAYSEVLRAKKEAQAALERARGETAALRSLANAARMVQDNPAIMNLRILQVLSGSTSPHTIVLNTSEAGGPVQVRASPKPLENDKSQVI